MPAGGRRVARESSEFRDCSRGPADIKGTGAWGDRGAVGFQIRRIDDDEGSTGRIQSTSHAGAKPRIRWTSAMASGL